jgi:hypothetical protein
MLPPAPQAYGVAYVTPHLNLGLEQLMSASVIKFKAEFSQSPSF